MSGKRSLRAIIPVCVCLAAAGCEVGPNYHKPSVGEPPAFSEATTRPSQGPATQPAALLAAQLAAAPTTQELKQWWHTFNDPELDRLIDRSVAANLDVQAAVQRVRQARAQLGVAAAGLYPTLDATGQYSHSRRSEHLGGGSGSTSGATGVSGGGGPGLESDFYQAGFDSTWEIDVFGGIRRGVEAAQANIDTAVENRREALITLLGDVATDYVQLRGLQRQKKIVEENITAQEQSLELTQTKNRAGLVADLDVTRQRAQVMSTRAQLPLIEISIHQTIHQLSILMASEPGALFAELNPPGPIPTGPSHVPPGLPAELLRRRPDIRQAERQLAAASANIGLATAELYPKFTLTGALGFESSQFHQLFNEHSRVFSIGPGIDWPIFEGGSIRANIEVQNALERQAYINYKTVILLGLTEVDDALIGFAQEQDEETDLADAVKADQRAVELTQDLYKNGLGNFLDVLTAQADLLTAQQQLTLSQQQASADLVALYKALGGGWEVTETQINPKTLERPLTP